MQHGVEHDEVVVEGEMFHIFPCYPVGFYDKKSPDAYRLESFRLQQVLIGLKDLYLARFSFDAIQFL